jgi:hypothetical protein
VKRYALLLVGAWALAGSARAAAPADCDRACLSGILDQYLAAMVAHDASRAPLARKVRYTENAVQLPLAEGLWFTATGLTNYRIRVLDTTGGAIGFVGMVDEHTATPDKPRPVILALRLKIEHRQITQAEAVVVRTVRESSLPNLKTPRPAWAEPLAPNERRPREELIRVSHAYFQAIERNDASGVPFDPECNRLENGMRTAGPPLDGAPPVAPATMTANQAAGVPGTAFRPQTCDAGMNSGLFEYITAVSPRRVLVVDEVTGVTFGVYMFQHRGITSVALKDGTVRGAPFDGEPVTMPMAEIFKIKAGRIRDVEAVGIRLPFGHSSGWN